MRRLIILLLSHVLFLPLLIAQQSAEQKEDESARIEIKAGSDKESYRAVACGRQGALIFFKSSEIADAGRVKWYFSFYDRDLKQVWIKSLPVAPELDYRFKSFSGDTLFLVFVYSGKQKNEDQPLEVVRIVLKGGKFIPNITKVPANSEPVFFGVNGRNIYLALNHKTGMAAVEILDLNSNHTKGFLVDQQTPSAFRWFEVDTSGGFLKAIVAKAVNKKDVEFRYLVFDTTGKARQSVELNTANPQAEFTGFRAIRIQEGEELISGTYILGKSGTSRKDQTRDESSGLFAGVVVSENQKSMSFINFLELKNISTLISAKELIDLKKKATKKNKDIKEFSADLSILQHDPFEQGGRYIQVSEVYSLQYHVENFTDFDFYGRPYTNSYSVFDGYRFNGAIITAYNPEGQLLWDNAVEIRDLVSPELSPKVVVSALGDKLLLAYYASGKIGSKIIRNEETTGKLEFNMPELKYPDDKLVSETKSGLIPWYDNFFLCSGFQDIKNVALESNNKRFVFHLTKVKFEE